jgi:hypothetical protein
MQGLLAALGVDVTDRTIVTLPSASSTVGASSPSLSTGVALVLGSAASSVLAHALDVMKVTVAAIRLALHLDRTHERPFLWRLPAGDAESALVSVQTGATAYDCSSCTARLRVYGPSSTTLVDVAGNPSDGALGVTLTDPPTAGRYYATVTVDDAAWPGARYLQGTLDVRAAPTLPEAPAPLSPAPAASVALQLHADVDLETAFRWRLVAGSAQTARLTWSVGGVVQSVAGVTATCGTSAWAEAGVATADGLGWDVTLRAGDTPVRGTWAAACRLTSPSWPGPRTALGTVQVR